jgi:hypothetical protein
MRWARLRRAATIDVELSIGVLTTPVGASARRLSRQLLPQRALLCQLQHCKRRVAAPRLIMQHKWKPGDLVVVVTVNRGLPVRQLRKWRKRQDAAESWAGEIAGPSLVGPGWRNVRLHTAKGLIKGSVYAVPDGEIRPRKH